MTGMKVAHGYITVILCDKEVRIEVKNTIYL